MRWYFILTYVHISSCPLTRYPILFVSLEGVHPMWSISAQAFICRAPYPFIFTPTLDHPLLYHCNIRSFDLHLCYHPSVNPFLYQIQHLPFLWQALHKHFHYATPTLLISTTSLSLLLLFQLFLKFIFLSFFLSFYLSFYLSFIFRIIRIIPHHYSFSSFLTINLS